MTRPLSCAAIMAVLVGIPSLSHAQGWADDKGTLSASAIYGYQFSDATYHEEIIVGGVPTDQHQANLEVEYVPLENLTVGLLFNTAAARYSGPQTGASPDIIVAHGENDYDGKYHYSITDLEIEVRYAILNERFGLSPTLRFQTPLRNYEIRGYAAHGSGLMEGSAGLYFNMYGAPFDNSFLGASYLFTLVERLSEGGAATEAYSVNRSDVALNYGFIIAERFVAGLNLAGRITHGGVNLDDLRTLPPEVGMWHDPILKKTYLMVSGMGAYNISEAFRLTLTLGMIPYGVNVSNAKIANLTFTWTMTP